MVTAKTGRNSVESEDPTRVTREEVARMLGLSVSEIRRRASLGAFQVIGRGKHGIVYYSRDAIVDYAKRHGTKVTDAEAFTPFSAEEANAVFAELQKGSSLIQCAMTTVIHPSKVRGILREYEALTGAILLDAEIVAKVNELPLDGAFPIAKASDVLSLLTSSSQGLPCAICQKKQRHMCKGCAIPYVRKQLQKEAAAEVIDE